jgi:hypothetical protein
LLAFILAKRYFEEKIVSPFSLVPLFLHSPAAPSLSAFAFAGAARAHGAPAPKQAKAPRAPPLPKVPLASLPQALPAPAAKPAAAAALPPRPLAQFAFGGGSSR